ncbi:MAG: hypothetical protein M3R27_13735 [Bacteroidota bacterium]|nr:hypothetical protein [Bacteroidota bacterium]
MKKTFILLFGLISLSINAQEDPRSAKKNTDQKKTEVKNTNINPNKAVVSDSTQTVKSQKSTEDQKNDPRVSPK